MRIKVLQYNILNGLCSEKKPYILEGDRKKAFFETLKRENPDIKIALSYILKSIAEDCKTNSASTFPFISLPFIVITGLKII